MTEPKKRGRPPKKPECKECGRLKGQGHADDCTVGIAAPEPEQPKSSEAAQTYASRVWAGQSETAPHGWRIERVKQALEGQNLPCNGVEVGGVTL